MIPKAANRPLSINRKPWVRRLDSEGYIKAPVNKAEVLLKEGKQKLIHDKYGNVSWLYEDTSHPDYDNVPINIICATSVLIKSIG